MGLESMGDLILNVIFTKLGPKETAKMACLSKSFNAWASEDDLWSKFCLQDLDLSTPLDPCGNTAPSFKETYQLWYGAFGMYPWEVVHRVKRCWDRLKNWLMANFPEAASTLRNGASETHINELEKILKVKLPIPTRILYRFCDGQDLQGKGYPRTQHGSPLGLIGGYLFYGHLVNVYLLPLHEVIMKTQHIISNMGFSKQSKFVVVAASSTFTEKLFFLNCTNGQLYVGTRNLVTEGEMIPCVPQGLIRSVHDYSGNSQQDAMLLWLEEHGQRLENGVIKLREQGNVRSICQFPEGATLCTAAVTNGVKVRASAVFVPELSDLEDESEKYWFSYSIRLSLVPEGCFVSGVHFNSCQLHWRHWIIRANDRIVSNVNGEGVIGKLPLLRPGEEEFVYESCTPLPTNSGSVEGYFTFIPGRLAEAKGGPFDVEVAQFPLRVPDYVF
ncbi:F-box protein SKIP16 [Linum perenne]